MNSIGKEKKIVEEIPLLVLLEVPEKIMMLLQCPSFEDFQSLNPVISHHKCPTMHLRFCISASRGGSVELEFRGNRIIPSKGETTTDKPLCSNLRVKGCA